MGLQAFAVTVILAGAAQAQLNFEQPPINYNDAPTHNPVSRFQEQLDKGKATLAYDEEHGYLPALLQSFDIPASSQVLVFSKTSLQLRHINPSRPRAVYFNDQVYIGKTRFGPLFEVTAVDPDLGAVFYTLEQREADNPKFVRDRGQCLTCHASSRTSGVPGHLVRSVYVDRDGHPIIGSRMFSTDQSSPLAERWGGWYVTGTHGEQRHMGNVIADNRRNPEKLDVEKGANVVNLSDRVDVSSYLSPHSDIVALMVLEHQTTMHNLITRANFETRSALHMQAVMNEMLDEEEEYKSPTTQRRIARVSDQLLEYMLYCDEYVLEAPIQGTSDFARDFPARGRRDKKGRSLRDLDLTTRLMKYPCSYLIYSKPFEHLPEQVKEHVFRRLHEVLTGKDESSKFEHLTAPDRRAIMEILTDTHPAFPPATASVPAG